MNIKKLISIFVLILVPSLVIGQSNNTRFFWAYDHEELTVANSAVPFTATKVTSTSNPINSAELASFTVSCASGTTCPISFLYDTGTPTTTVGQVVDYNMSVYIYGHTNIVNFLAIRVGATSAVLHVIYHR